MAPSTSHSCQQLSHGAPLNRIVELEEGMTPCANIGNRNAIGEIIKMDGMSKCFGRQNNTTFNTGTRIVSVV